MKEAEGMRNFMHHCRGSWSVRNFYLRRKQFGTVNKLCMPWIDGTLDFKCSTVDTEYAIRQKPAKPKPSANCKPEAQLLPSMQNTLLLYPTAAKPRRGDIPVAPGVSPGKNEKTNVKIPIRKKISARNF